MHYPRISCYLVACLGIAWNPIPLLAQFGPGGSISGNGTTVIKRAPELLRVQLELQAQGKSVREAIAKLTASREGAIEKLKELKANAGSIAVEGPKVAANTDRQRQMEFMVRQQLRQRGSRAKKETSKPVAVTSTITAEWSIPASTPEALLVSVYELQEKIRGALAKPKTEEESEESEEEAEQMNSVMQSDDGMPKPGEPVFMLVSKISEEDQAKAVASAFADAKAEALRLSKVAGAELGPTRGLTVNRGDYSEYGGMNNNPYMYQWLQRRRATSRNVNNEAVAMEIGEVTMPINVIASFDLK